MDLFARCFLLVFAQLYVGGMLALSVPPFHVVARGFYKSTAGVYLGAGALMLAGRFALLLRDAPAGSAGPGVLEILELGLWTASVGAGAVYLWTLWGNGFQLRARAYVVTWMAGAFALAVGSQLFRLAPALSVEAVIYPLSFLISAIVLGGVSTGMLLGHWYLIDHDLSIDPFRRLFRFFVNSLIAQTVVFAIAGAMLMRFGSPGTASALATLADDHAGLLALRLALSPVAAAGIAWMISKTLQIPQTMAATGLFYIAILAVLVGEMLGRFVVFRTSLPF
jgi:hypothetical protein